LKKLLTIIVLIAAWQYANAQDDSAALPNNFVEQQLENLAEQQETATEDDSYLQSLLQFKKNKLNLNTADAGDLRELKALTDLQIQNFLKYRKLLGNLISVYELQAVPTLDIESIQKILPFVRIGNPVTIGTDIGNRFKNGQHSILIRAQQVLEESEGFTRPDSIANRYLGSRQRVFARYKYVYRNLLQFGVTGDKDAGEQFFKGAQKNGFDFYSFHLFARNIGHIKFLALGDFTVNMGQGLIQWQSLAFKKSADITNIKRQADILRPYNSATEYNFQRGAGLTMKFNKIEATAFVSVRNVDANLQVDTISSTDDFVSSILITGFHRTPNEIEKKNTTKQTAFGGNVSYNTIGFHLGLNAINYQFSTPLVRNLQPYNQYAIQGNSWRNYSVDYSYTYKNLHLFGEVALDKNNAKALITGMLASLDPKVDASLVYRNIDRQYQALYANAFTEGSFPTNEKGLFAGLAIKPAISLRIDLYTDLFSFPWLRYRLDAPSHGTEYFLQLTYKPNKQVEVYTRYRNENKAINITGLNLPTRQPFVRPRQSWRTQFSYKINREVTLKNRVELLWYDIQQKERSQQGYLSYVEVAWKPFGKKIATNGRLTVFQTDGFDSRIYAFENDVLYSFSIPAFFDKGVRYYLNANYDVTRKMTVWARFAQTINPGKTLVGSGLDAIKGDRRTEVKLQMICLF